MEKVVIKKELDKMGRICVPKRMKELYGIKKEVDLIVTSEGILVKRSESTSVKNEKN